MALFQAAIRVWLLLHARGSWPPFVLGCSYMRALFLAALRVLGCPNARAVPGRAALAPKGLLLRSLCKPPPLPPSPP